MTTSSDPPPGRRPDAALRLTRANPVPRLRPRRTAVIAIPLLLAAAGFTMMACQPAAPTPAPTPAPAPTPDPTPTPDPEPDPDPTPQETRKSWALDAAHFRDDNALIWAETSNRSDPFAWDRITAGNAANVRVSIDGKELAGTERSFTSTAYEPAFASDFSGAEWTVRAEVREGAVVLVLEAPEQRRLRGDVKSITLTNPGSGYTSVPNIGLLGGGADLAASATVTAADAVASVTVTTAGSGYTSAPAIVFSGGAGSGAAATAAATYEVASVTVSPGGSGYTSAPSVWITGGGGSGAAATATVSAAGTVTSVTLDDLGYGYGGSAAVTGVRRP